jgi:hypothetical protein
MIELRPYHNDETRLHQVAAARGYARGWVWHRKQELEAAQ